MKITQVRGLPRTRGLIIFSQVTLQVAAGAVLVDSLRQLPVVAAVVEFLRLVVLQQVQRLEQQRIRERLAVLEVLALITRHLWVRRAVARVAVVVLTAQPDLMAGLVCLQRAVARVVAYQQLLPRLLAALGDRRIPPVDRLLLVVQLARLAVRLL